MFEVFLYKKRLEKWNYLPYIVLRSLSLIP